MKRANRTSVDTGEALFADMDTTDDTLAGKDEWHILSTKRNVDKVGEYLANAILWWRSKSPPAEMRTWMALLLHQASTQVGHHDIHVYPRVHQLMPLGTFGVRRVMDANSRIDAHVHTEQKQEVVLTDPRHQINAKLIGKSGR